MRFIKKQERTPMLLAAVFGAVLVGGAFAQSDTARVPFIVNVAATVTAVPSSGTTAVVSQVQIGVSAGAETVLRIPLPKSTGVLNGTQKQLTVPALVSNGGKVTLNLPSQSYRNAEISLYTVNGKLILRDRVAASETGKNLTSRNIAPGAYLLSVKGADAASVFTSRLTHSGGDLSISAAVGGNTQHTAQMAKEAAAGEWTVTVSAAGRVDSVFAFTPTAGTNPLKNITLRETPPVTPGLSAPTNVTATTASSTSITVSWSAVSGATDYYVYRGTSASGLYTRVIITSSTTYTNTGLTSGTTYYYKVSAYNGSAESPQSSDVSASTATTLTKPTVPTGVTATAASSSSITVSWSSVSGADGYYVYRATSATGTYSKVETLTSESTSYTNTGLSIETTYYYKISAYNSIGESSQSSYVSAKTPLGPLNPPTITATIETLLSITVSWPSVSGALSYRLYKSASANDNYQYVLTTQTCSYTDTGLSLETDYYYKVSVNNNAGEGALSSYATARINKPATGTFIDYRNEKIYKTVTILGETWMAENLDYQTSNSWCFNNSPDNCAKYGRLYTWAAAVGACPAGWHLSSGQEWEDLRTAAGGASVGKKLKSKSGWYDKEDGTSGNGTDDYGFSALPGGYRYSGGGFRNAGYSGFWWTDGSRNNNNAYDWHMSYDSDYAGEDLLSAYNKGSGNSVRCVKD